MAGDVDYRIIETIKRFHRAREPITAWRVGMGAGYDPATVSRWFRDHGIFWDHGRRMWIAVIPELAGPVLEKIPAGAIPAAEWLSTGWLRQGDMVGVRR
ncbi:hypothetical protein [Candidatus Methanocrinis natronophilus]|uniref:Uncharacterized protein n=1 Tax=Candidatus Methanocrinis natronophilus TaxID=3033396 RepID=A0ABT5XAI6_9EURY|nr:hypothetical protein [Candidatus Methanocrinis natronophilus]MDF0591729.1 hypothetical protein [Candidatus Methanocrinis natronophilus]